MIQIVLQETLCYQPNDKTMCRQGILTPTNLTHDQLLDIFERVGIELRVEIDEYFAKFNLK